MIRVYRNMNKALNIRFFFFLPTKNVALTFSWVFIFVAIAL